MRAEKWDFVQLNYALDDRAVERRLLPLAAERGIAVLVNQPFGGGGLLRKLLPRKLPDWAGEIGCTSWAQVLLKFVLANPAVTCVIPGTGKPEHMKDNVQAGLGVYPDAAMLKRWWPTSASSSPGRDAREAAAPPTSTSGWRYCCAPRG